MNSDRGLIVADILPGTVVEMDAVFSVNGYPVTPLHLCEWDDDGRPLTYAEFVQRLVTDIAANLADPHNPLRRRFDERSAGLGSQITVQSGATCPAPSSRCGRPRRDGRPCRAPVTQPGHACPLHTTIRKDYPA